MTKKALKMTSQLVIFRAFFSFFFRPPDPKSEKKILVKQLIKKSGLYAGIFSWVRGLKLGLSLHLHPYFVYTSSKGPSLLYPTKRKNPLVHKGLNLMLGMPNIFLDSHLKYKQIKKNGVEGFSNFLICLKKKCFKRLNISGALFLASIYEKKHT